MHEMTISRRKKIKQRIVISKAERKHLKTLIVIAKQAQQERENDFRDLFVSRAILRAISLPASFYFYI